jgi:hypothetical protein
VRFDIFMALRMMIFFWVLAPFTHWQMPTFQRDILSPSSGLKWQCWEVEGFTQGWRKGRLRE